MAARARRNVLPGFGLTLGVTIVYLSLLVLIPLSALLTSPQGSEPPPAR